MFKESGNLLLKHIDKIVLFIAGIVCLVFLVTKVLISPNYVEYEGRKLGPGGIDNYIRKQAEELEMSLNMTPEAKKPPENHFDKFVALLDSSFNIPAGVTFPMPGNIGDIDEIGEYGVPTIGQAKEAEAEHIRAIAYIPKEEISPENTYATSETEPNDLDFVTVEAKLDIAQVYESFYKTYAGDGVESQWRDPCLAVPIFAAVELQRQEIQDDGQWSDWQQVSRIKIDHMQQLLKIIEDVGQLPRGGMKVRQLQFSKPEVITNLLQPEGYQIASAEEEWFPPTLHRKFLKLLADEKTAEKREELARGKEEKERQLEQARSSRSSRRQSITTKSDSGGGGGGYSPSLGGGGGGRAETRERPSRSRDSSDRDRRKEKDEREDARTRERKEQETIDDVYKQFEEIQIDDKANFEKMEQDLLFWAHDDTLQPNKTYRYRIRAGLFNPLAGMNGFKQGSEQFKSKVILWSDFSETKPIKIPSRLYFFPTGIQEAADTIKIEIAKYVMGYWHSSEFAVKQGEAIGKVLDQEALTEEEKQKGIVLPEQVDYTTGAMLIDAMPVDDWAGGKTLRPRRYFNMYYSYDGMNLESMAIQQRYWPSDMQNIYNEIRNSLKKPKEPLRAWGGQMKGRQPIGPGPGGPGQRREEGYIPSLMGPTVDE